MSDIPEINITMESTTVTAPRKTIDVGRFPVCGKCGQPIHLTTAHPKAGEALTADCHHCKMRVEVMTLRRYVTDVRKETFDASKWTSGPP